MQGAVAEHVWSLGFRLMGGMLGARVALNLGWYEPVAGFAGIIWRSPAPLTDSLTLGLTTHRSETRGFLVAIT